METVASSQDRRLELDLTLLGGFRFGCRPDCGLCCFTSPRLEGADEARLRLAVPEVRTVARDGARCIASRSEGGACELLRGLRCSAHGSRPAPCREYPVSVHVGTRLQATLVLSCPGVELDGLGSFDVAASSPSFVGLDAEVDSVRRRLNPDVRRRLDEAARRRRRVMRELADEGRWVEEDDVRERLAHRSLIPSAREYAPSELPPLESGLDRLPMFFEQRPGPVALAQVGEAWEGREIAPEGGSQSLGVAMPPEQPPDLDTAAEELVAGYLRYWLARDSFLAAVHADMVGGPGGTVEEVALYELKAIGSDVLARGAVRARLRGESGGRLTAADVELGIRATDQDWLDRPTWGSRL